MLDYLKKYIDEKYDMEFVDDAEITVEEMVQQGNECLNDKEYSDSWDGIKESKSKLEKYIGMGYMTKYAICSIWNQGFIIFDKNYQFIDFIATI